MEACISESGSNNNEEPQPKEARASAPKHKRKKLYSNVWENFTPEYEDGSGRWGICNGCGKRINCQSRVGTSGLRKHMTKCASLPRVEPQPSSLQVPHLSLDGHAKILANLILHADLPLDFGESWQYVEFVQRFVPHFRPVSRHAILNEIVSCYNRGRGQLIQELRDGSFCVALTSDVWIGNEDFVSVAIRYVDQHWVLQKRVIGFRKLSRGYGGDDLAERILSVLTDYSVQNRIISITMDNAGHNDTAITILKPDISGFRDELVHQRCFLHILNLIVQAGTEYANPLLEKVRYCVSHLTKSSHRVESFKKFCRLNNLRPRTFALDMEIHWNSTYLMLDKILPYKTPFTSWVAEHLPRSALTEDDWAIVTNFHKILRVFYHHGLAMSAVYTPTSHHALHSMVEIAEVLHTHRQNMVSRGMVEKMEEKFKQYWSHIPVLYSFGVILDPRMKNGVLYDIMTLLRQYTDINYPANDFGTHEQLFDKAFEDYEGRLNVEMNTSKALDIPITTFQPISRSVALLSEYRNRLFPKCELTSSKSQSKEITRYLRRTHADMNDSNFDVLAWWKSNECMYPVLARFARDVLLVPVSAVSPQSAFSSTGRILDNRRMTLLPEMVETLTLAKDWDYAVHRKQHDFEASDELSEYFENLYLDDELGPSGLTASPSTSQR